MNIPQQASADRAFRELYTRVRALEAAVPQPANNKRVWKADGTVLETVVFSGPGVLKKYKFSNLSTSTRLIVALYDLASTGSFDGSTTPDEVIDIPAKLSANLDGDGVLYENGLCFAIYTTVAGSGQTWSLTTAPADDSAILSFAWLQ